MADRPALIPGVPRSGATAPHLVDDAAALAGYSWAALQAQLGTGAEGVVKKNVIGDLPAVEHYLLPPASAWRLIEITANGVHVHA
jgi:hypothetical protein